VGRDTGQNVRERADELAREREIQLDWWYDFMSQLFKSQRLYAPVVGTRHMGIWMCAHSMWHQTYVFIRVMCVAVGAHGAEGNDLWGAAMSINLPPNKACQQAYTALSFAWDCGEAKLDTGTSQSDKSKIISQFRF
jgi:hypothetical protein